ncbi:MAG TPA: pentapeptide repeat-containing protein [Verrucomicrobiae bacterium]|nr:pentapeptide repeat-containing protein [Verrucomicrobiae bacterium]
MPETPANQPKEELKGHSTERVVERLATPKELAEFGTIRPNPEIEAKILALLEAGVAGGESSGGRPQEAKHSEMVIEFREPAIVEAQPEPAAASTGERPTHPDAVLPGETEVFKESTEETRAETPGESQVAGSDLLVFAEVLDQHRQWVESGGSVGVRGDFAGADLAGADLTGVNLQGAQLQKVNLRGADLSMANLRGANLVEADLREANLLGAEFSGANLMGANLYGAQGLWSGRLGGTNLFDATLPEAVSAHDGGKTIAQATQSARWFYLLLIGLCLATCVLVGLTTDVRLLLDLSATPTSRMPNILPLQGFYLGAPLLLTVLFLRLQFLLLGLWGSIAALPAVFPDGQTPEKDGRWYLVGPIRPLLRWSRDPRSPMAQVESVMARLLVYWAVPAVLFALWLRYLVMQDYRGTLLHVFLITLASAAACGAPRIVARVLRPGDWSDESTPHFLRDVFSALRGPLAAGLVLFLLSLGVIRGLPADPNIRPEVSQGDPRRWAATAFRSVGFRPYADITEESVEGMPVKAGNGEAGTGDAPGPRLNEINLRFARGYRAEFANARMWRANLEGASLSEANFRGVNLREGVLRSVNMDKLQASKTNLVSADAQGANFAGADFQNADMSYANLAGAVLTTANLARATLYAVNLREANLLRADLSHADLRDTKAEMAVFSLATLDQTDLSATKLAGANMTGAQFKGTILLDADLSRTDLRGAAFPGAILRQAHLDGANLEGADLRGALGLEARQVCSTKGWRGAQLDADVKIATEQLCGAQQAIPQR